MHIASGHRRKYVTTATVAALVCGAAVLGITSASADTSTTVYKVGNTVSDSTGNATLGLFYNSNCGGATADFYDSVPNYAGYTTLTGSGTQQFETTYIYIFENRDSANGHGVAVKNNAASLRNYGAATYSLYYNSGYSGHSQRFLGMGGTCVNFDSTLKNNNASQQQTN
ncbi:hypothetical protein [Streptacidiphilus cavernicola]|uniref:Spore-associated protein A n=1 Tax=Streptacidiphilus cavernicola TaxID=3342716 RepID=A0ABV6VNP9_9ACTN